jgi:hypothetical protein
MTYTIKVLVLGKWLVASRGVSAVEASAIRAKHLADPTIQIVTE